MEGRWDLSAVYGRLIRGIFKSIYERELCSPLEL